jgi:hypothetical protein
MHSDGTADFGEQIGTEKRDDEESNDNKEMVTVSSISTVSISLENPKKKDRNQKQ